MSTSEPKGKKKQTIEARVHSEPAHVTNAVGENKGDNGLAASGSYLIRRDGDKDLKFTGQVVAAVSSQGTDLFADHARQWIGRGALARWRELVIYETMLGATVCHEARMTKNPGEVDKHRAQVINAGLPEAQWKEQVIAFFGRDALAKRLYDAAGISDAEEVL